MGPQEYIVKVARSSDKEGAVRTAIGLATKSCDGCGGCCGRVIPMTMRERARLVDHVRRNKIKPSTNSNDMCALLDMSTHRCMAYAARPLVCMAWDRPDAAKLFGTRPGQPCGLRADMAGPIWAHFGEYQYTDTWELFGIERNQS